MLHIHKYTGWKKIVVVETTDNWDTPFKQIRLLKKTCKICGKTVYRREKI